MPQQVVDQDLGVDFFLDVEWRGVDDEVAPVLLVLTTPDELRVEVGVARILHPARRFLLFLKHGLMFGGGDILPLGVVVLEGFDGFGGSPWGGFLYHFSLAQPFLDPRRVPTAIEDGIYKYRLPSRPLCVSPHRFAGKNGSGEWPISRQARL